jgi:GAF domain-containing protein
MHILARLHATMLPDAVLFGQFPLIAPPHRPVLAQALRTAARMLLQSEPMRMVLAHLAGTVESLFPGSIASVLVLDGEGLLRNGASPNLPADYLDAIDRIRPDARVGTCAAAAATGEVVLTPDFAADDRWAELRHLPLALGFVGAWSMPIKDADGRVLGTFGTYFRQRRAPTPEERQVVGLLAPFAAQAIGLRAA